MHFAVLWRDMGSLGSQREYGLFKNIKGPSNESSEVKKERDSMESKFRNYRDI